ncbi:MAG: 3,4-dihydroxy-2-butanone-4-phosphate synthase, partial [Schlesneria sp.]
MSTMIEPPTTSDPLSTMDEALDALKAGRMVIVIDAKERENEGDFVCAAESVTPEMISFMLRYGAGVLCVPLLQETADRLGLIPIVDSQRNTAPNQTLFMTPVDHRDAGSGVSADNRAKTILAMSDPRSTAADFVRPGHINPLLAKDGGVLRRTGHTEATVDLMRLAGLKPVGVLIEILSEQGGGMAEIDELRELATKYNIPLISIDQIIRYRRRREQLVTREV